MAQREIDLSSHTSVGLESFSEQIFDVAVSMGCGDVCPSSKARDRREWNLADPKNMDDEAFAAVRDEIESKVQALIRELDDQNS
jgi:arsenate reductase